MNSEYENEKGVVCQLCNKTFRMITPTHLKKSHETTIEDYKVVFPDAPISSTVLKEKQQASQRARFHPTEKLPPKQITVADIDVVIDNPSDGPPGPELIFSFLKEKYNRLEKGRVSEQSLSGGISFYLIMDMFDKVKKTAFNFPEAYWHSHDNAFEAVKVNILRKHGWKVYEINGVSPTVTDVRRVIE